MDNPGVMEEVDKKSPAPSKRRKLGNAQKAPAAEGGFVRRWTRRLAYAVAALLGLWLLTWLAVPPLAKWQGEKIGSEQLGRKLSIGAIDFKPWTLEFTVSDLAVASQEGAEPQLTIKRIYADAEIESLWRLAPVLDALQIEEPVLKVAHQGEGRYDFDDILERLATPAEKPAEDDEPARFALYNIDLSGGAIDFDDQAVGQKHEVRDLHLSLPFISNLPSKLEVKVLPKLAFVANGSQFDSSAQSLPFTDSLETDAAFHLAELDLGPYLGYIPAGLPVKLQAATVNADLRLGFEQTPKPSLRVGGHLEVSGLKSVDGQGADALSFDALKIELADVRPLEQRVHLASVELSGPHVAVRRDRQGQINLLVSAPDEKIQAKLAEGEIAAEAEPEARSAAEDAAAPDAEQAEAGQAEAGQAETGQAETGQAAASQKPLAWHVAIDKLSVHGGTVDFTDEVTAVGAIPAAKVQLENLELLAEAMAYPFADPLTFKGAAALVTAEKPDSAPKASGDKPVKRDATPTSQAATGSSAPSLEFEGSATDRIVQVNARVAKLPLAVAAPYVAQILLPHLNGALDAQVDLKWAAAEKPDVDPLLQVAAERIVLSDLMLAENVQAKAAAGRKSRAAPSRLASVRQVELTNATADLQARAVTVGKLSVVDPKLDVQRDARKRWMYESWLREPAGSAPNSKSHAAAQASKPSVAEAPWKVALEQLAVTGGAVGWRDDAMGRPVRADLTQLTLEARQLDLNAKKPMPVTLSARLGSGRADPGRLSWRGTVNLEPLAAQGVVDAQRLPVHAFEPYFGDALNIDILRADASFKGRLAYTDTSQGPRAKVSGDVLVEELRTHSRPLSAADTHAAEPPADNTSTRSGGATITKTTAPVPAQSAPDGVAPSSRALVAPTAPAAGDLGEELLSWKLLKLAGLEVSLEPGQPAQVDVKNTLLSDFYARLIIHQNGRINLQDLVKSGDDEAASGDTPPESSETAVSAGVANGSPAGGTPAAGEFSAGAGEAGSAPAISALPAVEPDPNAPVIRFGPIELANGRVLFSDRFIRPNYSADLSELNGSLSAFSSVAPAGAPEMADLKLTGRAEGSASLDVSGKLNPLAKPLALDIKGQVRDLELPPLTPYSVKYAGHGIERGKLSVDVAYTVQPDGRLTATNKLVLNQLEFGEPVEGAPASLPVKLATALLADSKGVIDLDLPISGSLNDPQFSLGPIIFKAVVNLIGRAITAPFTLLARALGGGSGDDLAQVPFAPGTASLSTEARSRLDKVAQALKDRPALKVTVVGAADLDAEREGWRRERLNALVAAEKRSSSGSAPERVVSDAPATSVPAEDAGEGAGQSTGEVDKDVADGAASGTSSGAPAVSATEYPALLKRVYRRADLPGKPRNAIGMTKDIPVAEMEALLMASMDVSEDAIRRLAIQRGVAVKDYLASQDLPTERLFLGAAHIGQEAPAVAESAASAAGASKAWAPHAQLNLSAK